MRWIARKPAVTGPLADLIAHFRTPACRTLASTYADLMAAAPGRIPAKAEFDVSALPSAIPHLALCAVTRPGRCIYRVAGEALQMRIGFNPTGQNYYDFVPAERRAAAARAMEMVVRVPCAFRAEIEQNYSNGLLRLIEAVGFPLRSDEPGVDGFIIFADTTIEPIPRRGAPNVRLLGANVVRRDLIDLGFGIDPDFVDLVRAR